MKAFQVLFVLAFTAIVSGKRKKNWKYIVDWNIFPAKPKCSLEPTDCRYNTDGSIVKDLNYLVPFVEGLKCKSNKQPQFVDVYSVKYLCCAPNVQTTECQTTSNNFTII